MEFINAMKEAAKIGISASSFQEIWMASERRKFEEEEWQRKLKEREWMQDSLITQESENNTEIRTRRLSPATSKNRSGAVFTNPGIPRFSGVIDDESKTNERETNNNNNDIGTAELSHGAIFDSRCSQEQRLDNETHYPPNYEKHHHFKTVVSYNSRTMMTKTLAASGDNDDDDTTVKTPHNEEDSDEAYEEATNLKKAEDDDEEGTIAAAAGAAEEMDENLTPEQKSELLNMIKSLSEEQKALKTKLTEHDERLNSLIKKQPSVQRRLTGNKRQFVTQHSKKIVFPKDDEKIYAQIEQLYTNFCRINLLKQHGSPSPSSSPSWLPPLYANDDEIYSTTNCTVTVLLRENAQLQEKIEVLERAASMKTLIPPALQDAGDNNYIESLKFQDLQTEPTASSDVQQIESTFEWEIPYYSEKLQMERVGKRHCTMSDTFEIGHPGYLAQLEIFLNGNGTGQDKCLSLFMRIIRGKFDEQLEWPALFTMKFILINQEEKRVDSLIYGMDDNIFRYEKPSGDDDNQSDSWGLVEFVPHTMIASRKYIKDDVIKVRVVVRKRNGVNSS